MPVRFSIIVPSHNNERFIATAIDSILRQSYPAHEIIVVDDASTDNTSAILAGYGDKIVLRRRDVKSGSPSAPRNEGRRLATGDYLVFLDADDFFFRDYLKHQAVFIENYPQAGVLCGNYFVRRADTGHRLKTHFDAIAARHPNLVFDRPLLDAFRLLIRENFPGGPSSVTISREVADEVGDFVDGCRYTEDYDYWFRCCRRTFMILVSKALVFKRTHRDNLSNGDRYFYTAHAETLSLISSQMRDYIAWRGLTREFNLANAVTRYNRAVWCWKAKRFREALVTFSQGCHLAGGMSAVKFLTTRARNKFLAARERKRRGVTAAAPYTY